MLRTLKIFQRKLPKQYTDNFEDKEVMKVINNLYIHVLVEYIIVN